MKRELDLDARRAARAEQSGEPPVVVFGGEKFDLPAELPLTFMEHLAAGRFASAVEALVGDQAPAFLAHGPSMEDLMELSEMYAVPLGKGSNSTGS